MEGTEARAGKLVWLGACIEAERGMRTLGQKGTNGGEAVETSTPEGVADVSGSVGDVGGV